jgi:hypothetical protein
MKYIGKYDVYKTDLKGHKRSMIMFELCGNKGTAFSIGKYILVKGEENDKEEKKESN